MKITYLKSAATLFTKHATISPRLEFSNEHVFK